MQHICLKLVTVLLCSNSAPSTLFAFRLIYLHIIATPGIIQEMLN